MFSYEEYVIPHRKKFKMITITESEEFKVKQFSKAVFDEKKKEAHHQRDPRQRTKRFTTGMLGEVAIEKFIRTSFVDWEIGPSTQYNVPDLKKIGLNVGIKTVETGKFPIIHKKAYRPEIIVIRGTKNRMVVCGLATVDVLNTYQSDELILDNNLRREGKKTGFYGFSHLIPFKSIDELKAILKGESH